MTFEEWFHKEYEPADLQFKQSAEKGEVLSVPAKVYLEDLKKAFEAGRNEIKGAEIKEADINQSYKEFRRQVRCKWH